MKGFLMLSGIIFALNGWAQTDSLIQVTGKIISAETKQPVEAKIAYQSLPYGNKMGVITGSSFTFPLYDRDHYSITISAVGYATAKYLIDPAESSDGKITKEIELGVPALKDFSAVGTVMRLGNLNFEQGRARIASESFPELDHLAELMIENRRLQIQLEGHTDPLGNATQNLRLSQQRVDAVRNYLINKGAKKTQVKTKAFGGSEPVSTDDTLEAHALNRRVEVRILAN